MPQLASYKIYLTRSPEVANLLVTVYVAQIGNGEVHSVSNGAILDDQRIPAVYHNKGYFMCVVEFKPSDNPRYELIIC